MIPIWLLDVDGVLNARRPGWSTAPRTGRAFALGTAYRIRWAPQALARIRALHESGRVEIRWATTWVDHDPAQLERLLDLPPLTVAYPPDPDRAGTPTARAEHLRAKLAAALAAVRAGAPVIWTDDEAIPASGAAREELDAAGALLVAPDGSRGLRPDHLDAIADYLARHAYRA